LLRRRNIYNNQWRLRKQMDKEYIIKEDRTSTKGGEISDLDDEY